MHHPLARALWQCTLAVAAMAGLVAACGGGDGPTAPESVAEAAADDARAVAYEIPPDGGTLVARGADGTTYTLHIPTGALPHAVRVRVAPMAQGGVLLQPVGLAFHTPAELSAEPAATSGSAGTAFQLRLTGIPEHAITTSRHDSVTPDRQPGGLTKPAVLD